MHHVTIEVICTAVRMRRRSARRMRRIAGLAMPEALVLARATAVEKEARELEEDLMRDIKDDEALKYVREVLPNEPA